MSVTKTATLKVPGASLYYEITGSGPPLLIPGAPADAGAFGAIAAQLADRYTVMTYDWRGSSRSPLDEPPGDLPGGLPTQQFITTAMRTVGPHPGGDESGPPGQEQAPQMPDPSQMSPEMVEGMARMQANSQFFLAYLLPATIGHVPDVAALRAASPRIVVGAGDTSAGQMPHLAALALAERLGVTPVGFPGDHQGFATHP